MSLTLASASIAGGVAVSNERAVFMPISGIEHAISETARAFAAIASPPPVQVDSLYFPPTSLAQLGRRSMRRAAPAGADPVQPGDYTRPDPLGDRPDTVFGPQASPEQIMASAQANGGTPGSAAPAQFASLGGARGPGFYTGVDNLPGDGNEDGTTPVDPTDPTAPGNPTLPVPEPASWVLMIGGFGVVGGLQRLLRTRRSRPTLA
jgi:hypothetical protein